MRVLDPHPATLPGRNDERHASPRADERDALEPLITLASALLDTDRLRIAARLVEGPANRMELAEITGLPQRDLLRQLGILQDFGLVRLERDTSRPDHYSRYELNVEAFRAARQAVGKHKGRKPRPTDARLMTHVRLDYPVEGAMKRIAAAGLPRFLAERLQWGE